MLLLLLLRRHDISNCICSSFLHKAWSSLPIASESLEHISTSLPKSSTTHPFISCRQNHVPVIYGELSAAPAGQPLQPQPDKPVCRSIRKKPAIRVWAAGYTCCRTARAPSTSARERPAECQSHTTEDMAGLHQQEDNTKHMEERVGLR